jgi:hypothetical protein
MNCCILPATFVLYVWSDSYLSCDIKKVGIWYWEQSILRIEYRPLRKGHLTLNETFWRIPSKNNLINRFDRMRRSMWQMSKFWSKICWPVCKSFDSNRSWNIFFLKRITKFYSYLITHRNIINVLKNFEINSRNEIDSTFICERWKIPADVDHFRIKVQIKIRNQKLFFVRKPENCEDYQKLDFHFRN